MVLNLRIYSHMKQKLNDVIDIVKFFYDTADLQLFLITKKFMS